MGANGTIPQGFSKHNGMRQAQWDAPSAPITIHLKVRPNPIGCQRPLHRHLAPPTPLSKEAGNGSWYFNMAKDNSRILALCTAKSSKWKTALP